MKDHTLSAQLLDKTVHLVVDKVQEAIADTPEYPYQKVFVKPFYRELLLLCVVREIYARYRITQDERPTPLKLFIFCTAKQTAIVSIAKKSAVQILENEPHWMDSVRSSSDSVKR